MWGDRAGRRDWFVTGRREGSGRRGSLEQLAALIACSPQASQTLKSSSRSASFSAAKRFGFWLNQSAHPNLANRFYRHFEEYFRFISEPGIDPTNNVAEQVQRFVAIHRRMTQGTRSERGRGWWERMCTAVTTCDQQARSSFQFLFDCVTAWIAGAPAPSLVPAPANTS